MWPFRKKHSNKAPKEVFKDGTTARYDSKLDSWTFELEEVEFHLSGIQFKEEAFDWARQVVVVVRSLDQQIKKSVAGCLEGRPCNTDAAQIFWVNLDDYKTSKTFDLAFGGDDSWGDFGVNVIVTDGKIVNVFRGD